MDTVMFIKSTLQFIAVLGSISLKKQSKGKFTIIKGFLCTSLNPVCVPPLPWLGDNTKKETSEYLLCQYFNFVGTC